jgi:hypothetical protein
LECPQNVLKNLPARLDKGHQLNSLANVAVLEANFCVQVEWAEGQLEWCVAVNGGVLLECPLFFEELKMY